MSATEFNFSTGQTVQRELTADELAAMPAEVPPTPLEKLRRLDVDNTLTQRNLRETIMLMNEAFKTISGGALDLSQIPGVAQVYAVEAQAEALRAQL